MATSEPLRRLLVQAETDPPVLAVLLFGSGARGEASSASDVDVCLVLRPEAGVNPSEERLRYLAEFDLDVHVFQELPLYVRSRVLKEGRILLAKDEDTLYELAIRTAKAFEDFKPQPPIPGGRPRYLTGNAYSRHRGAVVGNPRSPAPSVIRSS